MLSSSCRSTSSGGLPGQCATMTSTFTTSGDTPPASSCHYSPPCLWAYINPSQIKERVPFCRTVPPSPGALLFVPIFGFSHKCIKNGVSVIWTFAPAAWGCAFVWARTVRRPVFPFGEGVYYLSFAKEEVVHKALV